MKKLRGFRLGRKLLRGLVHRRRIFNREISKVCKLGHLLKQRVKGLCFGKHNSGYIRVGQESIAPKQVSVPKEHLIVYVGEKKDDTCRMMVPVIYFNHPLFAEFLREAEMVYGYNHSGGIQIPCRISEFENVKSRIAATGGGGNCRGEVSWRHK